MSNSLLDALRAAPVVPLITPDNVDTAEQTLKALEAGGLRVFEIVLRTDNALANFAHLAERLPDCCLGAGTVLTTAQAEEVISAGAKFIVCPGLDDEIVALCQARGVPIAPGIATATELQRAWKLGLRLVKFFPAGSAGGPKMIKDLSGPFRDVKFMPTGGVNADNLQGYLSVPAVIACGGSWLTPGEKIARQDFEAVTELATQAMELAQEFSSAAG